MPAVFAVLVLGGCETPMNLPEVAHRPPLEIGTPTQPIAFAGGTSKISHGTQVGAFPSYGGPWSFTCGKGSRISLEWGGRMAAAWSSELGEIFYDTLKAAGYDVVGNPQRLFDRGRDLARARYQVGARLLDLRGNFCSEVNFWTGEFSNRYRGLSYIRVEWEVYSVPERRVIAKLLSEGRGKMDEPAVEGNVRSLQLAFADAAANLAADESFSRLMQYRVPQDLPKDVRAKLDEAHKALRSVAMLRGQVAESIMDWLDTRKPSLENAAREKSNLITLAMTQAIISLTEAMQAAGLSDDEVKAELAEMAGNEKTGRVKSGK